MFKNDMDLNVGDECYITINGRIFGKSYVEDIVENRNLIGINLPDSAEKYLKQLEYDNIDIKYEIIKC